MGTGFARSRIRSAAVLERLIFKHRQREVFMVADAYRGKEIAQATWDFLEAASGRPGDVVKIKVGHKDD